MAPRKRTTAQTEAREETTGKTVMEKILILSFLSESVSNVENCTGQKTMNHCVRKKVEMVEVTTHMHEKLEVKNK